MARKTKPKPKAKAKRKPASKKRSRSFGTSEPGSGERFAACVREMSRRRDIYDPAALCATIGRRKYGKAAFQRMAAAGKLNPSEEATAAALSEAFHGRPAQTVTDLISKEIEPFALAELGRLIQLVVILPNNHAVKLNFAGRRPRVCASPDGGQIYVEGGQQALKLDELGLTGTLPKHHLDIGHAYKITYHTSKAFHSFAPTDYYHFFGDEGGTLPAVGYDVLNQRLYFIGGTYQVRPEGIVN